MRIETFNRGLGDFAVMKDLKNGKTHIVFLAVNGLTFFNALSVDNTLEETEKEISSEQATRLCNVVNEKNETGTLYPKLNITILPLTRYENREDWDNEDSMKKNINDAFKANSLYIKSKEMIFAFENRFDFNNKLAVKMLEQVAREYSDNDILKKIYYVWD